MTPQASATPPTKILILGGGFAGVYTALHLEKLGGPSRNIEVTLISRDNYFLMTPLLFEAGSGVLEPRHAVNPIRPLLRHTRFVEAEIKSVDLEKKIVAAAPSPDELYELPFDHLVIAVGGITNTTLIAGSEHTITFKTLSDAIYVRNHTIELFERADVEKNARRRAAMMTFVIIGAGLVGTELVGELTEFVHNVRRSYKNIDPRLLRFELIEAGKKIVPEMDKELTDYAAEVLTKRGVNIRVNARVKTIEPGKIQMEASGDQPADTIEAETIILATGVRPAPLIDQLPLQKDRKGRITTDAAMLAAGQKNIWCLGDCASIPDPNSKEGRPYPQLAQHALREAKVLAANILATIDGQPTQPFIYSNKGVLAALGHFRGVGRIYKFRIYSFPAWWVWRTYYLLQMPQWQRRIRIVIDWTVALLFKNDIVKLEMFGLEHPTRIPKPPAPAPPIREQLG